MPINIENGKSLTATELMYVFKCSSYGGMRRSKKTNSLVLISYKYNKVYKDRIENNEILFTGMGLKGDQDINFRQNKTLANSNSNNVQVYLFEVSEPNKYIFKGQVKLNRAPFREKQFDKNGKLRNVWIFPLKYI